MKMNLLSVVTPPYIYHIVSGLIWFYVLRHIILKGPQSHRNPASATASLTLGHCHYHKVKPFSYPSSVSSSDNRPYIVRASVESSMPNYHGLDDPGFVIKDEQNRGIRHWIRRGLVILIFSVSKQVVSFYPGHFFPLKKSLCCICVIPGLYLFIGLVRLLLNHRPFLTNLLCHHLSENRYAIFLCHGVILIYSEYLILPDRKLVGMTQNGETIF